MDNLVALMINIGKEGNHIFVRYDPIRKKNNFTVCINGERIGDGKNPVKIINEYLIKDG